MQPPAPKRFGIFIAPFHPVHENPALALERDFQLVEHLDALGYDEAWIGEHHSAGYEIIASPELFIAEAACRTRRIRLGTGVSSVSYHHPLMLADRIMQLDYQTRGRVIFGVGPGQLPSDAFMQGIAVSEQRRRMDEATGAMARLLAGETVTMKSDWFTLDEARLQLVPYYQRPRVEMAVAAAISPSGARTAGKYGLGMLSVAASDPEGFNALAAHWSVCEELAARHGRSVDRSQWRLVVPMHIAETREQAVRELEYGLVDLVRYVSKLTGQPLPQRLDVEQAVERWTTTGLSIFGVATVGTPDDAVARIRTLEEKTGGFGTLLLLGTNVASFEATRRSAERIARYVVPAVAGLNAGREASLDWVRRNSARVVGELGGAIQKAIQEHQADREASQAPVVASRSEEA